MEIRKYEAFLKAVELGSFTAAADELKYTTAGIGHMVESIETELGVSLLKRGRSGVALTRSGEELIADIRQLVQSGRRLSEHADALRGILSGSVAIGAYYSISSNWLPSVFQKFSDQFPQIHIRLREGGHQLLNQWMADGQLDLMLTSYDARLDYEWIPLRKDRMVAVLPENHPLASGNSVSVSDCLREKLIMPALGRDYDVYESLKSRLDAATPALTTVESYSAMAMVEQGLGISIMNELITLRQDYRVVKLPLEDADPITLGIYVPSLSSASPAAQQMIRSLMSLQSSEFLQAPRQIPRFW